MKNSQFAGPAGGRARLDPVLVEAARAGDTISLETLLILCQPDLRRYAARTCASSVDVEDAMQ
jgi:DNA-directed RNA polymerase specialized sigma24 family protein